MYKVKYGLTPSIVDELFKQKSTSHSLRNSDFHIPTLTLLTMENILLDIKDLIYGRIYIKNWKAPRISVSYTHLTLPTIYSV